MVTNFSLLFSAHFYVDPLNGNINNDGSINAPWRTIEEVIAHNLIKSYRYNTLPFDPLASVLIEKNSNAPVSAGDTIFLRSGEHGEIFLRGYYNLDYITIVAEEGHTPIIKKIQIQAGEKWRFSNLTVSPESYFEDINKLVYFESHGFHGPCKNITIQNCNIYTTSYPWTTADEWVEKSKDGIYMRGDSMQALSNTISNVDMGITALGDHILVHNNQVINFSGDGVRILGSFITIAHNLIKNCYDVDDNHDDGIQSFTTNGLTVDNNIVTSNIIINNEDPNQNLLGPLQGIGCFDGFYNNWIIENNLIIVNHWHGITFLGANNCKIINNTVLDPTPHETPGASWIMIDDHKNGTQSTNCIVKNNVTNKVAVDAIESHNTILNTIEEYKNNFVDFENFDFHLKSGSILLDAADNDFAPLQDLDGLERPQGNHADIGCYEFEILSSNITTNNHQNIVIYPNPTNGLVHILKGQDNNQYTVNLISISGKLIFRETVESNQTKLELNHNQKGVYFLQIINSKGFVSHLEKIIIN